MAENDQWLLSNKKSRKSLLIIDRKTVKISDCLKAAYIMTRKVILLRYWIVWVYTIFYTHAWFSLSRPLWLCCRYFCQKDKMDKEKEIFCWKWSGLLWIDSCNVTKAQGRVELKILLLDSHYFWSSLHFVVQFHQLERFR